MERRYTENEKKFLRKFADLCSEYGVIVTAEVDNVGIAIVSAPVNGTLEQQRYWNSNLSYIQRGLISERNYVIGHKVVFRDTGRSGTVTGAYWRFAEPYDYEATMDDDGSVVHFTDDDNFYTL